MPEIINTTQNNPSLVDTFHNFATDLFGRKQPPRYYATQADISVSPEDVDAWRRQTLQRQVDRLQSYRKVYGDQGLPSDIDSFYADQLR